jgi:ankyrin repeat protein
VLRSYPRSSNVCNKSREFGLWCITYIKELIRSHSSILVLRLAEQIEKVNVGLEKAFGQRENHHHDQATRYLTEDQRRCHQVFKTSTYERFKNINPNRVEGTCEWVLKSYEYLRWWKATSNDLLWISADPGCGKSVLAKSLIDGVFATSDSNISIVYFFFKDNDEQNNLATALCAVLHQLFSLQPQLLRYALPFWERNKEKIQHEVGDMWRILMAATSDPAFEKSICVFDALDECRDQDQKLLIEALRDFHNGRPASQGNWLKFLVTSRPYDDIQDCFQPVTECFPQIHLRGEEENDQIHEEINLVVRVKLAELGKDLRLPADMQGRLERELCAMKHRTYLWLSLAIDDIKRILKNSLRPERETIPPLPKNVPEAYERILNRVPFDQKATVEAILRITVGARRPLTVQEMAMALGVATSPDAKTAIDAGISPKGLDEKIRQLCGLFVFIKESKIYLIHQTAREFLISKHNGSGNIHWHLEQRKTDVQMTEICVKYLLMNDLIKNDEESVRSLLDYSAENWADHFRDILSPEAELVDWVWKLYDVGTELFSLWFPKSWKIAVPYRLDPQMKALHLAAFNGHPAILRRITLDTTSTVDLMDRSGKTALLWASERGHSEIIRLLLEKGADINAQGGENGNAIQCAAREGNLEIVQLLLEKGADINAQGGEYDNALQGAVRRGHLEIVQLLLENGADVNARHKSTADKMDEKHGNPSHKTSTRGMTALHFSALNGNVGMTMSLCFHHANPNAQSETGDTPLHLAIRRSLLGSRSNDYRMNGEYAVEDLSDFTDPGSEEFFEVLGQIDESRVRIVDVLLSTVSIDVNIANHNGDCLLHVLPFRKECASEITLKLIEKGAKVSKSNNKRQTCLHLACKVGNLDVVRILVSRGCSIILQDIYGLSPLHYAVEDGSLDVVRYLLEQYPHHALDDRQQRDFLQMKLLHHHVKSLMPSVEIIKLLSQHGFEPNELNENGDSVLSLYLRSLHWEFKADIFDCLIEIGASMSWVGEASEGLIHLVMCQWDKSNSLVLERLLQIRDIRAKDDTGRNILHHGAIHGAFNKNLTNFLGEENILSLLNENDFQGKTPLDYAEEETLCERDPDSFGEERWNESLQNFKILHEETSDRT